MGVKGTGVVAGGSVGVERGGCKRDTGTGMVVKGSEGVEKSGCERDRGVRDRCVGVATDEVN